MKTLTVAVLAVAIAIPIHAGSYRTRHLGHAAVQAVSLEAVPVPDGAEYASRLMAQMQAASHLGGAIRGEAVIVNRSSRSVLIPAAGSVRGAGNTFFRSDITFANWNVSPQDVAVYWMTNGSQSAPTVYKMTLPGDRPPFTAQDFVGSILNTTGLGALLFIPITSTGDFDANGAIDAYSRIWTPQPNATGTVSQPFPGVDPDHLKGDYEAFILGLRSDSAYRTNYGIVNLHSTPLKFLVTVFPESAPPGTQLAEARVTLPSLGMIQQSLPGGAYTTGVNVLVEVDENVPGSKQSWSAYASSTDNITGDGWVSIATKDYDDETLDSLSIRPRGSH